MAEKHEDPMMYRSIARKKLLKEYQAWSEAVGIEEPTPYMKGKKDQMDWTNKSYDLRIKPEEYQG